MDPASRPAGGAATADALPALSAGPREVRRRQRLPPLEYVLGERWVVLKSAQLNLQHVLDNRKDCALFLLDISLEDMAQVESFLKSLVAALEAKEGDVELPPLIALLPSAEAAPSLVATDDDGCDRLLAAQGWLHELGLDEVILKGSSASETHVSVRMAIERLVYAKSARQEWEQGVRQEERAAFEKMLQDQERLLRAKWAEELWSHAGELNLAQVFPPVDASVPSKLLTGAMVGDLKVEGLLGKGGFGTVCLAHNTETGAAEAIKVFQKQMHCSAERLLSVAAEIDAMRNLRHVNVVSLLGVVQSTRHVLMRMEYAGPSTLMKALVQSDGSRLPLSRAADLYRQLTAGVAYCHSQGIAHCDLKPENLGLDDQRKRLKVLDFGCAARMGSLVTKPRGTMPFMAPEVLLVEKGGGYEPGPADIWATGVVLTEMIAGIGTLSRLMGWPTVAEANRRAGTELLTAFERGPAALRNVVSKCCGPAAAGLIRALEASLAVDPGARSSAAGLAECDWCMSPGAPKTQGPPMRPSSSAPDEVVLAPRPQGRGPRPISRLFRHVAGKQARPSLTEGSRNSSTGSCDAADAAG